MVSLQSWRLLIIEMNDTLPPDTSICQRVNIILYVGIFSQTWDKGSPADGFTKVSGTSHPSHPKHHGSFRQHHSIRPIRTDHIYYLNPRQPTERSAVLCFRIPLVGLCGGTCPVVRRFGTEAHSIRSRPLSCLCSSFSGYTGQLV